MNPVTTSPHHDFIFDCHKHASAKTPSLWSCPGQAFRPVLSTVPTRGWGLLLQGGGGRGDERRGEGGKGGREGIMCMCVGGRGVKGPGMCEAKPRGLQSIQISQFPVLCHQVLKSQFWTVSWVRHADSQTHTHTYGHTHTDRLKTAVLTELIYFHLPCVSSSLVFAVERHILTKGPSSLFLLTGFPLPYQLAAAALFASLRHQVEPPWAKVYRGTNRTAAVGFTLRRWEEESQHGRCLEASAWANYHGKGVVSKNILRFLDAVFEGAAYSRVWHSSSCAVCWSNVIGMWTTMSTLSRRRMFFLRENAQTRPVAEARLSENTGERLSSACEREASYHKKRERERRWKLHFHVIHFLEMAANPWTHLIRKRAHLRVSILL